MSSSFRTHSRDEFAWWTTYGETQNIERFWLLGNLPGYVYIEKSACFMTSLEISFVAELNFLSQIKFLFPHCSPLNSFMPTLLYSRYPISGIFLYLISCAENNTYTLNNLFFSLFFFLFIPWYLSRKFIIQFCFSS